MVMGTESQAFVFITLRVGGKSSRLSCSSGNLAWDTLLLSLGTESCTRLHTGSHWLVLAIDEP